MKRFLVSSIFIALLCLSITVLVHFVYADELEDINKKLDELQKSLQSSIQATNNNEQEMNKLNTQLEGIKAQVAKIEQDIVVKEKEIEKGDAQLKKQKQLLDTRIVSYYKNKGKANDALLQVLVTDNLTLFLKQFTYQQSLLEDDRRTIIQIVSMVRELEEKKANLESEQKRLIPIKEQIAKQSTFLSGEVASAKSYQSKLQQEIVTLSAKQQEILSQRISSLNIPRSAGTSARGCSDDRSVDPGFSPRLAFFTYGAPNRVGLNQYGAKGRADSGQNYEAILKAYYNFDSFQDGANAEIKVNNGNGINQGDVIWTGSLEEYIKRIYEMPGDWPIEALKAQAIAARSYVLAATSNGRDSICANENCQAFQNNEKTGSWVQAASDTSGKVMIQAGQPIKSWYSSTHGGYVFASGEIGWSGTSWTKNAVDTTSGGVGSFDDLNNNAYDRSSPWFYCDWGSRPEYNKTAWLKAEEVADIVNTLLLVKRDSGTAENLYQTDKPNPAGKETWNADKVKSELRNKGGSAYNSVSDISVSADFGSGKSVTVNVNGDAGSNSFSANEFKDRFNLRAPANLQIVGPLFNVEKK